MPRIPRTIWRLIGALSSYPSKITASCGVNGDIDQNCIWNGERASRALPSARDDRSRRQQVQPQHDEDQGYQGVAKAQRPDQHRPAQAEAFEWPDEGAG